jgi:hypothetical protein
MPASFFSRTRHANKLSLLALILKESKSGKQLQSECSVVKYRAFVNAAVALAECILTKMLRLQALSIGRKKTVQRTEERLCNV